ncbi:MAG: DUF115 domain-containing protein [Nitrospirae bacterium]|nr:DUF115 domain-containing protein [Nitrospirota bacterium]
MGEASRAKAPGPGDLGRRIAGQLDSLTLEKVGDVCLANAKSNTDAIASGRSVEDLAKTRMAQGEDALVIAAGPSIHRFDTARLIRESGFEGVIIAAESSLAWCLRSGIAPDLVVTLDSHPERVVRWFGDPHLTEEAVWRDDYYSRQDMDPKFREDQIRFNRELTEMVDRAGPRIKLAVSTGSSCAVVARALGAGMNLYWWNPMLDDYEAEESLTRRLHHLNGLPCINAGGNVGAACWVIAHAVLRKKRIGLIGMDLGYYADMPYERTQYFHEIVDLVGRNRLDEMYVRIHNPHVDKEFYTDPAYLWYRDVFLEMAGQADCETYNCTGGGILFGPSIRWSELADFARLAGKPAGFGRRGEA